MNPEVFLTRQQVAKKARVHIRTVDGWRKRGLLTTYRTQAGHVSLSEAEVNALLTHRPEREPSE